MIRQSSSRNQRSKGVRVKHILQICILFVVCFWLIYQVKRSHDKRKNFVENEGEVSEKLLKFDDVIKLGRKDLHPRDEELSTNHEKIDDEDVDEEEALGKGDETLEETQEELERELKKEGSADVEALLDGTGRRKDARGLVDDDDIDEQDLDKMENEADGVDDVLEEEKDNEKEEENETVERDVDDDNEDEHQRENHSSSDDQDHDSSGDRHEAREEHYKADDASSAVEHVDQNIVTENAELKNIYSDAQELVDSADETGVSKEQQLNATNVLETPPRLDNHEQTDTNDKGYIIGSTLEKNSLTERLSDANSSISINGAEHSPTITSNTTNANMEYDENSISMSNDISASDLIVSSNLNTTSTNHTDSFNTDEHEDVDIRERKATEEDSILSSLNDEETLRDPLIYEEEDQERGNILDLDTLPELRTKGTDSDDAATE